MLYSSTISERVPQVGCRVWYLYPYVAAAAAAVNSLRSTISMCTGLIHVSSFTVQWLLMGFPNGYVLNGKMKHIPNGPVCPSGPGMKVPGGPGGPGGPGLPVGP